LTDSSVPESADSTTLSGDQRYRAIRRVTLIGALVNLLLAIGKITLGFIGQSQALIADGVHSLADLFSDGVVLVAAKQGSREADDEHPYGHGRIETVVTVGLGAFLIAVAAGIMYDAVLRIMNPELLLSPTWYALVAAAVSIFANEGLYQYTAKVGKSINSRMLIANAWHHRTDAISSIIALVGIGGALAGLPLLDAVAAIGVSIMIAKVGWSISWGSLRELIDTALGEEQVARIRKTIESVDGVKEVHALRTRSMGGQALVDAHILQALVDAHILVRDSFISVSEGHQISEAVQQALLKEIDEVTDVVVHIDPEDDEVTAPNRHLPVRGILVAELEQAWAGEIYADSVQHVLLHYLNGKISVEVVLPLELASVSESIQKSLQGIAEGNNNIKEIIACYRIAR
jgi:cation diffusion facilitator family transporter